MRVRTLTLVVTLAVMPAATLAQEMGQGHHAVGINSIKPLYEQFKGWIIASAEQMPEADYGYQPTPEVRTFGQMIGHIPLVPWMHYWGRNIHHGYDQRHESLTIILDVS